MPATSQNFPLNRLSSMRNVARGLPFGGSFNNSRFVTAEGPFNPAMVIKWLPLRDLSKTQIRLRDDYQDVLDNIRHNLKRGDMVTAISIEDTPGTERRVNGMVHDIVADYDNRRVHIYVQDFNEQNIVEVHPESIYRDSNEIIESKQLVKFSKFGK